MRARSWRASAAAGTFAPRERSSPASSRPSATPSSRPRATRWPKRARAPRSRSEHGGALPRRLRRHRARQARALDVARRRRARAPRTRGPPCRPRRHARPARVGAAPDPGGRRDEVRRSPSRGAEGVRRGRPVRRRDRDRRPRGGGHTCGARSRPRPARRGPRGITRRHRAGAARVRGGESERSAGLRARSRRRGRHAPGADRAGGTARRDLDRRPRCPPARRLLIGHVRPLAGARPRPRARLGRAPRRTAPPRGRGTRGAGCPPGGSPPRARKGRDARRSASPGRIAPAPRSTVPDGEGGDDRRGGGVDLVLARAVERVLRWSLQAWRELSVDAKVVGAVAVANWLLLFGSHTTVAATHDVPLWQLFPFGADVAFLTACGALAATYPLRDRRSGSSFTTRDRAIHLATIVVAFVILPAVASVVLRETGRPYTYIHDGALMVEEAARKLLHGMNPYVADYLDTPMFYWPMVNNPALYHLTYFPFMFLVTLPFVWLFDHAGIAWDQRYLYLPAYVATLALVPLLVDRPRRLALVALVALNPQLFPFVVEGRNDFFVLLPLFAGVLLLQR